jgi:hypothetical protein
MEFSTSTEHQSKAFPDGVTFSIRRMGISKRTEVELATADLRARQRELQRDLAPLYELDKAEYDQLRDLHQQLLAAKAEDSPPILDAIDAVRKQLALKPHALEREKLEEAARIADRQIEPAWVRAGLISIEGITVNGKPLDSDVLCEYGPRELFAEVFAAVWAEAYLSGTDSKNLPSPITSGQKVDGPISSSIAPSVEAPAAPGTESETAAATSQIA